MWRGGGNCDERKRVKVLKMGWRSTRVTMVNILSWALMNTFMVVSVRARQDQTPSYEELGELEKILHSRSLSKCWCVSILPVLKTATQCSESIKNTVQPNFVSTNRSFRLFGLSKHLKGRFEGVCL